MPMVNRIISHLQISVLQYQDVLPDILKYIVRSEQRKKSHRKSLKDIKQRRPGKNSRCCVGTEFANPFVTHQSAYRHQMHVLNKSVFLTHENC